MLINQKVANNFFWDTIIRDLIMVIIPIYRRNGYKLPNLEEFENDVRNLLNGIYKSHKECR